MSKLFKKTPLAWRLLTKQKARFVVALAGIAFADVLMFVQLGFEGALYDAAIKPYNALDADLIMANPQFQTLISVDTSPRERLYQTLSYPGVESVSSLYIGTAELRNPDTLKNRSILVWGIEPESPSFKLPELAQNVDQLKQLNTILFDSASRSEYGPIAQTFSEQGTAEVQLSKKTVRVGGLFAIGSSFAADGNIITSDSTFLQLFPDHKAEDIEVGLIHVKPGTDIAALKAQMQQSLPNDVRVLTPEEFGAVEKEYWANGTSIGFIFGIGVIMGFIVGIVIVYQILYSDVSDHLAEFATLKAMGYGDRYLVLMLMQEALLLSLFGFLPSFLLSIGLYQITYAATMLPIAMKLDRAINVLILTIVMCTVSGAIAIRKLQAADPADVF
ncbi:MAG TPA: ABC transporter permease DevC [Coleofasciculaceae cyanobacterium]|jgi:putative ABC transport system permease protein